MIPSANFILLSTVFLIKKVNALNLSVVTVGNIKTLRSLNP